MPRTILWTALLVALAPAAAAERLALAPRHQPGDAFSLSLSTRTDTETMPGASDGRRASEAVRLTYQATVTVLEVTPRGALCANATSTCSSPPAGPWWTARPGSWIPASRGGC